MNTVDVNDDFLMAHGKVILKEFNEPQGPVLIIDSTQIVILSNNG